ncbi:MAG: hypothetical protein JJ900_16710 [Rhodospirillales bacterium]|nr:hypothetical protein [Rhodospirillales bacterium]MBO6788492.1 hypothetical protein [Rhodospirillales bacterium]
MSDRNKTSEVIMYGEKAQPSQQRAEIIEMGPDGKPKVTEGGFMDRAFEEKPQPAQPAPAAQAAPAAAKPAPQSPPKPKNPASAKAQSKAIATNAVGSLVDEMKQKAASNGGMLSMHDLDSMQSSFDRKAQEMQAQIEASLDEYADARDKVKWDKERVDPFYRLIVKPFAHLFAESPGRKTVTRRMLPGYFMAIRMLLGPDNVAAYDERCRNIVARLRSESDSEFFDWDSFYTERDALTVRLDAQMIIASHFSDFDKRADWFITLVNSNLAGLPDSATEAEAKWSLAEQGCRRMLDAMLSDLRKVLSSDKGRERLIKRHGAEIVDNANTALKRLLMG